MNRRRALALMLALSLSACASMRGVDYDSGGDSYRISVRNNRSGTVTVSYNDGTTTRELGQVAPGASVPFVVVSKTGSITVYARSSSGANLSPQTVSLSSGTTNVTIR